jgi:hypothetical protein
LRILGFFKILGAIILGFSGGGALTFFGLKLVFIGGMALNLDLNSICPKLLSESSTVKIKNRICFIQM